MAKIKNSWLENMPANTLKGNDTGSEAPVKDLTATEVSDMLSIELSGANQIWCGPVVELPGSNTIYADVELPEMIFEYNQHDRLDSVFEAET